MEPVIIMDNGCDLTMYRFTTTEIRDSHWQICTDASNMYKGSFRDGDEPLLNIEECPQTHSKKCPCHKLKNKLVGKMILVKPTNKYKKMKL